MTTYTFRDNAAGAIPALAGSTVNYVAGTLQVKPQAEFSAPKPKWRRDDANQRFVFDGWEYQTEAASLPTAENLTVKYAYGDALAATVETFAATELRVDVTPGKTEDIVPGSLRLALGGRLYVDQPGGIYADVDPATGAGAFSGTLDPSTGLLAVAAWAAGQTNAPTLPALATRLGKDAVDEVTFVAPGAPVQSGSVQITALDTEGNILTATAATDGGIAAAGIEGHFYYQAGVGRVRFGAMVTAAGNETQPWYDPAQVVGGMIWRPRWAIADTIRFNCATVSYLPLDPAVLGLNPARLPGDGRGPAFRAGDLVAIHHTGTVTDAAPAAGATVNLPRGRLERVWVRDANGQRVPGDRYTVDLGDTGNGALTWAAPLNLAGYVAPFAIHHRIMHKTRIATLDISGRLGLRLPLNHDFPAGAMVSSCYFIGDMQGRVERVFTQSAWVAGADGSYWADTPIGTVPLAQYDQVSHPIAVSNLSTHDRYALIFQTSTTFQVVSKGRGVLAQNRSINEDYTLLNSVTGDAEFTIHAAGWGAGWQPGNVVRLDVIGGKWPAHLALCVQEGAGTVSLDHLTVEFMGDYAQ